MQFRLRVVRTGSLKKIRMTTEQYRELGGAMLTAQKKRIQRGINADGYIAKPLVEWYRKQKRKMGRKPIRDMTLTGDTMNAFRVVRAYNGLIRAEPTTKRARKKAFFCQRADPMIGFTDREERAVIAHVRKMLGRQFQVLWRQE